MKIDNLVRLTSMAALAVAIAAPAQATTFVGTRDIGAGSVQFSFTTDDTIGVLSLANILDYSFTISNDTASETLFGVSPGNSFLDFTGSALTATATQLLFDFDGDGALFVDNLQPFDSPDFSGVCINGNSGAFAGFCTGAGGPNEIFALKGDFSNGEFREGVQLMGSAVPEPATWAFMIFGFGAIGGALRSNGRRQRKANVKLSYA